MTQIGGGLVERETAFVYSLLCCVRLSQVSTLKEQLQHEIRRRQPSLTHLHGASWEWRRPAGHWRYDRPLRTPAAETLPCITLWPTHIFTDQISSHKSGWRHTVVLLLIVNMLETLAKLSTVQTFPCFPEIGAKLNNVTVYWIMFKTWMKVVKQYSSALCTMGPLDVSTLFSVCCIII